MTEYVSGADSIPPSVFLLCHSGTWLPAFQKIDQSAPTLITSWMTSLPTNRRLGGYCQPPPPCAPTFLYCTVVPDDDFQAQIGVEEKRRKREKERGREYEREKRDREREEREREKEREKDNVKEGQKVEKSRLFASASPILYCPVVHSHRHVPQSLWSVGSCVLRVGVVSKAGGRTVAMRLYSISGAVVPLLFLCVVLKSAIGGYVVTFPRKLSAGQRVQICMALDAPAGPKDEISIEVLEGRSRNVGGPFGFSVAVDSTKEKEVLISKRILRPHGGEFMPTPRTTCTS
ncbi:hypothetical protein FHG87_009996 [Trinorchestia longiramus]|nr:hypothetical protein FHG87_009996 [Trinorchestia longiramus]